MDLSFDVVVGAIFAGIVGYFAYRIIRYKGFKGAMFGAEVVQTLGEVEGRRQGPLRCLLRVHILKVPDRPEPEVGIELVAKSFASYQIMPISLSRSEAQRLASLLQNAHSR